MGLICVTALLLRVGYVFGLEHPTTIGGDAYVYHFGAQLLVHGKGFIDPYAHNIVGQVHQTAQHPPLYTLALAVPSALGLGTFLDHQLWSCVIGTATVGLVAVVGRRLGGPRVGLLAAGLAAVYPDIWISDAMVAAETLALLTTVLVLWGAYRFWDRPSPRSAAVLGVACAIAALTRAEAALLLPLVLLPWAVATRRTGLRRRAVLVAVAALAAAITLGPWVGYNLARFDRPVLVTSGLDLALVQANCDQTYYGAQTGYYSFACIPAVPAPRGDESDDAAYFHQFALRYITHHESRVPFVAFARLGRTWGFYHPLGQIEVDSYLQGWNLPAAQAGLAMYALLVPAAAAGLMVLRRRRIAVSPLVATVLTVSAAGVLTFGQTRYRLTAEATVVLLAAVAVDWCWTQQRWLRSANGPGAGGDRSPGALPGGG
ncbi:MAG: glycosyltransferase family 39 protein [Actinomycetota bacterium]|nr:glycosyltransferase family 39 protein [Actinomycetota bacterium]